MVSIKPKDALSGTSAKTPGDAIDAKLNWALSSRKDEGSVYYEFPPKKAGRQVREHSGQFRADDPSTTR
jgi:hypothetical protein